MREKRKKNEERTCTWLCNV